MTKDEIRAELTERGAELPPEDANYKTHENALRKARESDTDGTDATDSPWYCPGCGRRSEYQRDCVGMSAAAPHPAIEMVSTDELAKGKDPAKHTPAPNTG